MGVISSDRGRDHVTEQDATVPPLSRIRAVFATHRRVAVAGAGLAAAAVVGVLALLAFAGSGEGPTSSPTSSGIRTAPTPSASAPAPPPPAGEQFGANVGRLFNDRAYSSAQIDAQLAALARTGATVARSDALWEATEPAPPSGGVHRYDWTFDDAIAGALAENHLRWLPIIDYTAPWAQSVTGQDHSPPASTSDYAAYAGALARRYGPGGRFWAAHPQLVPEPVDTYEIWNEPDNPAFWTPTPDAAAYADLYMSARGALGSVQPTARVIIGGLTHPTAFMAAMLGADPGLRGHIDGVGIHPYGATPQAVLDSVRAARLGLSSLGLGTTPLYVTEFGWTTHPPGALDWAPAGQRPGYVSRTLAALGHTGCGVAAAILYAWVTPERDRANPQDWFGISPPDGGATPDTVAFTDGLRSAAAPQAAVPTCT